MQEVRTCDTRDGLNAINEAGAELVIWQRSLPTGFRKWIDRTDVSMHPDLRILVQPGTLRPALEPRLDKCGLPATKMRDLLIDDIQDLVRAFADVTRSEFVDVRLERINHNACRKFHRDNVEARLVTTYRGPTTQWVETAYAETALQEQKLFEGPLEHLASDDVAIFKGSCADHNNGVVHRSPPVEGTGRTRLFLCLNKKTVVSPPPYAES